MPPDHLAHFVIDAVESLELRAVPVNTRGTGDAQNPTSMPLGLLVYNPQVSEIRRRETHLSGKTVLFRRLNARGRGETRRERWGWRGGR